MELIQNEKDPGETRYEPFPSNQYRLICVSDASLKTGKAKVSQGGYFILLTEKTPNKFGGICHVLEVSSKKATRVAKSSMAAEVLGLCRASEAGQRMTAWLHEIWYGAESASELIEVKPKDGLSTMLVTDAYDVYLTMRCPRPYQGQDLSMTTYVESLREDLAVGRMTELAWIPTKTMLPDSLTKDMEDVLITQLMKTGIWTVPWADIKMCESKYLVNLSPSSISWLKTETKTADKEKGCGEEKCYCWGKLSLGLTSSNHNEIYWQFFSQLNY